MQRPKTIAALALTSLTVGALTAGCASAKKGPQTTLQGTESLPGYTELNSGQTVSRDLEMLIQTTARKNGFLVVQLELHNKRGGAREFEWTCEWYDQQGLKIDSNQNWRPLVIGGEGYETIQITAPTQSAESWKLRFQ